MSSTAGEDGRVARGRARRSELLAATRRLVAREGVSAVSHRAVAAEAGVPKSSLAYHFTDTDGLLAAALAGQAEELVAAVPAAPAGADPAWLAGELVALFTADRDQVLAGYELYLLAARRPALRAATAPWLTLLAELAGTQTHDPDRVRAAVAVVDGWFVQHLIAGTTPQVGELERLLEVVLGATVRDGLSPQGSPADEVVARLRAAGCVFAEDEARLLHDAADGPALDALVARRVAGEPLEQLLGWVDFSGLRVQLDRGVFVPRQRTALLVETAVALGRPGAVVVDLCCGSGAIGLAVAAQLPGAQLVAADLDPVAVANARAAVEPAGGRVHQGDLFAALPADLLGRVDLLCVNAPYVPSAAIADLPPEARDHEPITALDGGPDGLDLHRRVAAGAGEWLAPGGHLLIETSDRQAAGTAAAVTAGGFTARVVRDDERGATVVVGGRWTSGPELSR